MSLLHQLSDENVWRDFYEYKTSLICTSNFADDLKEYIEKKKYIQVSENILRGHEFPLPKKSVISKMSSEKKRTVYTYPEDENMVLKLLTHLMLRKYDYLFCKNLYSFRPGKTAKDAVRYLSGISRKKRLFSYKVDISNYFNSVPVDALTDDLRDILSDDAPLFDFLKMLLDEKRVIENNSIITEKKGIMAGTPVAAFYANVFLRKLDEHFIDIPYARYSDDIILFSENEDEIREYSQYIKNYLERYGLKINTDKEFFFSPDDGWNFLGFSYKDGIIDIAPCSVKKIKQKMRRKTRALMRWQQRNELGGEKAAAAFVRIFNKKLLESVSEHTLSWKLWFFSIINTSDSLKAIDDYAQECIRFLISGTHTKARYNVRYSKLKELGYRSLVHEYYQGLNSDEE